jgi:hypothetical protein
MNADEIDEEWLTRTNERFRAMNLPPKQRPFKALQELALSRGLQITLNSPAAEKIFQWFLANTQPGAHAIGPLYTGVFFYDACFWPVTIPIFYGRVRLDAFKALETMPDAIKGAIKGDPRACHVLAEHWRNCLEFALGFDVLRKSSRLDPKAHAFLRNGEAELTGAMAQLLELRPNLKAILMLRQACEIFLKVLLIQEKNLSDDALKKLGHDIRRLAQACMAAVGGAEFQAVDQCATVFPPVAARYDGTPASPSQVFDAVALTQMVAAAVVSRYAPGNLEDMPNP